MHEKRDQEMASDSRGVRETPGQEVASHPVSPVFESFLRRHRMPPEEQALSLNRDVDGWERFGRAMIAGDRGSAVDQLIEELLDSPIYAEEARMLEELPASIVKDIQLAQIACLRMVMKYRKPAPMKQFSRDIQKALK